MKKYRIKNSQSQEVSAAKLLSALSGANTEANLIKKLSEANIIKRK